MNELEVRLQSLADRIEWPPTPPLGNAVRKRLAREPEGPRRRVWPRPARRAAIALAVFLFGAGAAMAASSDLRHSVLRALGLEGAEIVRVERVPPLRTAPNTLGLGDPVTLREARAAVGFAPLRPHGHGWVPYLVEGELAFRRGPLLLGEFRGATDRDFVFKALGPGTTIRDVSVRGTRGWWIAGEPHEFAYTAPDGEIKLATLRLAANTLIWNERGLLVRIEGASTLRGALAIAASLRRHPSG